MFAWHTDAITAMSRRSAESIKDTRDNDSRLMLGYGRPLTTMVANNSTKTKQRQRVHPSSWSARSNPLSSNSKFADSLLYMIGWVSDPSRGGLATKLRP